MRVKGLKLRVKSFILLFTVHCLLSTVFGCGYTLQGKGTLPFDSVRIGRIENRTYEPKLEDKLHRALADELMKHGIMISDSSDRVISGVIDEFELKSLSEKKKLAVEYEVIIKGKFSLASPSGKTKELRRSGPFIVSLFSSGSLEETMALKDLATEAALRDLSSEIVAGIIYGTDDTSPADRKPQK